MLTESRRLIIILTSVFFLIVGCSKKSDKSTETSSVAPMSLPAPQPETPTQPPATQPAPAAHRSSTPASNVGAAPAMPASDAPTATAAPVKSIPELENLGLTITPNANQAPDQQVQDQHGCSNSVQQKTGFDPTAAPPRAPATAGIKAAAEQAAIAAATQQAGKIPGMGGAAGGVAGALIGGVPGSPAAGVPGNAAAPHAANPTKAPSATSLVTTQLQAQYQKLLGSYTQNQGAFKKGFSDCMVARNYSVN
jgi:hypothetical protein